jgi:hypothetical protein
MKAVKVYKLVGNKSGSAIFNLDTRTTASSSKQQYLLCQSWCLGYFLRIENEKNDLSCFLFVIKKINKFNDDDHVRYYLRQ